MQTISLRVGEGAVAQEGFLSRLIAKIQRVFACFFCCFSPSSQVKAEESAVSKSAIEKKTIKCDQIIRKLEDGQASSPYASGWSDGVLTSGGGVGARQGRRAFVQSHHPKLITDLEQIQHTPRGTQLLNRLSAYYNNQPDED